MTLNLDRQFYLIITDHKSGAYVPEQNVCEMDRAKVIKDIAEAQYTDVVAVIEFNPAEHSSRDVTESILSETEAMRFADDFEATRVDRQTAAWDRARDLRKHEAI
jgi:hypothetical protein